MGADDRIERVTTTYDQAVYGGDAGGLTASEQDLDAVEADLALARGRILHARFLHGRSGGGPAAAEDPAELSMFERAATLYQASGDVRGQGQAAFWLGCLHQVIRRDNETAVPHLERSARLAAQAADARTQAEALRHLGIAAHMAGRFDQARELLTESSRLRRQIGAMPGVATNMVGLAYIAAAQGRPAEASETLDQASAIAHAHQAHAIVRQIEQARTEIVASE